MSSQMYDLAAIRRVITVDDWPPLVIMLPKSRIKKFFSKYNTPDKFHNAFLVNDDLANRVVMALDEAFSVFVEAAISCDAALLRDVVAKATDRDSMLANFKKMAEALTPLFSRMHEGEDLYKIKWAFIRQFNSVGLHSPLAPYMLASFYLIEALRAQKIKCSDADHDNKNLLRQIKKDELQIAELNQELSKAALRRDEAIRVTRDNSIAEIDDLRKQLEEKDRKINELERKIKDAGRVNLITISKLVRGIKDKTESGRVLFTQPEDDGQPDMVELIREFSQGLSVLVVGGGKEQYNHRAKLDTLASELGMTATWELAQYDDVGRAMAFLNHNVPKYDIAIFLHWNRTEVHKKGLDIARKHNITARSCYYKGFISLREVIFDMIMAHTDLKSMV